MKRIVIKVGSHVLSDQNRLSKTRIDALVKFLFDLTSNYEVIFVSSGAVAAGYGKLKIDKNILENRQAIASVGQPYLMSVYRKKFEKYKIEVAQVLLTADDFDSRKRTQHAKNAINVLLKNGVIPIINENDTTAVAELFGDNDQMSSRVAHYFDANMLVILSDIDGYYDKDPREHNDAKIRKIVNEITSEETSANYKPTHKFATGGIVTKLKAAHFMLEQNKEMFMADGFNLDDIKSFLLDGIHKGGTLFTRKAV